MTDITIYKQLAAKQDIEFGVGTVMQRRNGVDIEVDKVSVDYTFNNVADMKAANDSTVSLGMKIATRGYTTPGDGGGAVYLVSSTVAVDEQGDHTLANGLVALVQNPVINVMQYGSVPGTESTAALQAAFEAQNVTKKPIYVPQASASHISSGTLNYYGYGLFGDNANTSILEYTGSGVFIKKFESNDFGRIEDIFLKGPGYSIAGTVGIGHDGNTRGWFRTQVHNVRINDFELAMEVQFSLFCTFNTLYIRNCKNGLFFIGGGTGWNNTWYNNEITFINCIWDDVVECCLDFVGIGLSFAGTNTMQSSGDGVRITRDDAGRSNVNTLDNLYFEFNEGKDIDLKDTFATLGPCMFQSGPVNTPGHNIFLDNTDLYVVGRPAFLDNPALRVELINDSKYIAMHTEIVSNKIITDSTSEYVYIPTRLEDKRKEQIFNDLDTTPVQLAAPISTSSRYTNHIVEFILEAPNGEYQMFTTYGKLASGSFRTGAVSGGAVFVSDFEFTVNAGGVTYTFKTVGANGTITIEASSVAAGETKLITRVTNSRASEVF